MHKAFSFICSLLLNLFCMKMITFLLTKKTKEKQNTSFYVRVILKVSAWNYKSIPSVWNEKREKNEIISDRDKYYVA